MPARTPKQRGHDCARASVRAPAGQEEKYFRSRLLLPNLSFCRKCKSSALMVQSDTADFRSRLLFSFCEEVSPMRRPL